MANTVRIFENEVPHIKNPKEVANMQHEQTPPIEMKKDKVKTVRGIRFEEEDSGKYISMYVLSF